MIAVWRNEKEMYDVILEEDFWFLLLNLIKNVYNIYQRKYT